MDFFGGGFFYGFLGGRFLGGGFLFRGRFFGGRAGGFRGGRFLFSFLGHVEPRVLCYSVLAFGVASCHQGFGCLAGWGVKVNGG